MSPAPARNASDEGGVGPRALTTADPGLLAAAADLRHRVFVLGQGVPPEIERDGRDDGAVHAVATRAGAVLGTARLLLMPPEGTLGRLAVDPAARRQGLALALVRCLESAAVDRGLARLRCHAQVPALAFWTAAGWAPDRTVADGGTFVEAGIDHVGLVRELPVVREAVDADGPALVGLIAGCWSEYPGCVMDVEGEEPWLLAPRAAYDRARGRLWVVEQAGEVVACCGVKPVRPGVVELKSMYVARAARRQGLARRLEALVVAEARRRGAPRVELWSDSRFLDAHTTYATLGYERLPGSRDLHDRSATTEWAFAREPV